VARRGRRRVSHLTVFLSHSLAGLTGRVLGKLAPQHTEFASVSETQRPKKTLDVEPQK